MRRAILFLARFAVGLYYRRTRRGAELVGDGPLLVVANHPNGLVDPVVVGALSKRPVRFLAKAPLFRIPVIGWIARRLGSLPVHRASDGADTSQNASTFEEVFSALAEGDAICLFPEGLSHSEPELQRLKTGAARMALGAEARNGYRLGVRIQPVGLVYRAKRRFRSPAVAWVGEPMRLDHLAELHARDEPAAVLRATEEIATGLRRVVLELDRWEDLPLLTLATSVSSGGSGSVVELKALADGLRRLRRLPPERPERRTLEELAARVDAFGRRLERIGLTVEDLGARRTVGGLSRLVLRGVSLVLLGLPLALAGTVFWWLPYRAIPRVTALVSPSRELWATVQLLAGALLAPAWLAAASALAWRLGGTVAGLSVALAAPPAALFALAFVDRRRELVAEGRALLRLGGRRGLREHLEREREELALEIERLRTSLAESGPSGSGTGSAQNSK